jgi:arylsulfatase A-like enzyme
VTRSRDWLFWGAVWLALVLIGVKAYYLWTRGNLRTIEVGEDLSSLAAITYRDVTFALAAWASARAALLAAGNRRWAARIIVAVFIAAGTLACLYQIASIIAFGVLGGFLTYALLQLVGNVRMLSSSVGAYLNTHVELGLVTVPLTYVGLVWLSTRFLTGRSAQSEQSRGGESKGRWLRGAIATPLLVAWTIVGQRTFVADWATHYDWRVADNAPWVLASSWWRMRGDRTVRMAETFPAGDLADFEPIGQRKPLPFDSRARSRPLRAGPPVRSTKAPNVILLVLESVSTRWTSFGGLYDTTPALKAEAAHALVFDNMYAHIGRSSNSLAAILLSMYPRLDFREFTEEYQVVQRTSLASVFRDRGYRTAFMTPSDLSWAGWDAFLHPRGFDEARDYRALTCSPPISSWGVEDRCLVEALIPFIEREPGRPFFVMGWTQQTHHPYEPTPGVPMIDLRGGRAAGPDEYDLDRYLNVLHETDRQLARLFDALRRTRLADDTLVIVVGDHGQAFGYPHDSYMQGRSVYEEDVHVPLMIWWPRRYKNETHARVVGGHVDLAPTIAELTGVPAAADWQGRSLLDASHPPRAYFYVAQDEFKLGVREEEWKYIFDLRAATDELYDLLRDPEEKRSVSADQPERSLRLRQRLAAFAEANRRQYEKPTAK